MVSLKAKPKHHKTDPSALSPQDALTFESEYKKSMSTTKDAERRWAGMDNIYYPANQTYDTLPPGLYRCSSVQGIGPVLKKSISDTDSLLNLPDSASETVLDEIKKFWTLGNAFNIRGLLHKRGVLMYGPPGSGKTATVQLLVQNIVEKYQGIAIYIDSPTLAAECLQMVRRIEPKRPVIGLLEDFDALVDEYGENEFLSLLDGEAQVDNIVFVATTNYPEDLDRRFVDRPSRFDLVIQIGMPTPAARKEYLKFKEKTLTEEELVAWVEQSDGFSIAHLRELVILCRCYEYKLEDAIERLTKMREQKLSSDKMDFGVNAKVGFLS